MWNISDPTVHSSVYTHRKICVRLEVLLSVLLNLSAANTTEHTVNLNPEILHVTWYILRDFCAITLTTLSTQSQPFPFSPIITSSPSEQLPSDKITFKPSCIKVYRITAWFTIIQDKHLILEDILKLPETRSEDDPNISHSKANKKLWNNPPVLHSELPCLL